MRSARGRAAFARTTVVWMRSFSIRFVTRLRKVARRCAGLRPSLKPDLRCLILAVRGLESRGFLRRRRSRLARERRPDDPAVLVKLHPEAQAHLVQDVFDFIERLAAK